MKKTKLGKLNPMFNKEKSQKFIEQMYKDKSGINNPMYGKNHSIDTLEKLRKKVYVYNSDTKELEKIIDEIIATNPDQVAQYRAGKEKLFGLLQSPPAGGSSRAPTRSGPRRRRSPSHSRRRAPCGALRSGYQLEFRRGASGRSRRRVTRVPHAG